MRRVLTDYHVHLRPDEPGTTAERYLTADNAERYRLVASERGIAELGVSEHVYRFTQALDGLAAPVVGRDGAATTSTPTARSCASRPT
jgi:hypothetical protein